MYHEFGSLTHTLTPQGKSALWSHLLHYQAREERLEQKQQAVPHVSSAVPHIPERRKSDCSIAMPSLCASLIQDMRCVLQSGEFHNWSLFTSLQKQL